MPELPEVETVVRDLRPLLVGRTIRGLIRGKKKLREKWDQKWDDQLSNQKVNTVDRRGKWIIITFASKQVMIVHLGMTGQLTVVANHIEAEDHTHFVFRLSENYELRYRDIRRFGSITVHRDRDSWIESIGEKLGPEPWDMSPESFRDQVRQSSRNLKAILLDQSLIAGVGNIYADESCFEAGLNPRRKGKQLKNAEADRLLVAIRKVLDRAILSRGSTIRNYVGGSGLQGGFQDEFKAYGRTGLPCVNCSTPIKRIVLAGRATHFCTKCQK